MEVTRYTLTNVTCCKTREGIGLVFWKPLSHYNEGRECMVEYKTMLKKKEVKAVGILHVFDVIFLFF